MCVCVCEISKDTFEMSHKIANLDTLEYAF